MKFRPMPRKTRERESETDRRVLIPQFVSEGYLGASSPSCAAAACRHTTVNLGVVLPRGVVDYHAPRSSNSQATSACSVSDDIAATSLRTLSRGFCRLEKFCRERYHSIRVQFLLTLSHSFYFPMKRKRKRLLE